MTKITLTWQGDAQHDKSFNEEVELRITALRDSDNLINKVESAVIKEERKTLSSLQKLEGSAIIVALDDCIEQLSIIKFMLNENGSPSWNDLFKYESLDERLKTTPRKKQKFQEEIYEKIPYTDHQKLQKDICFLTTTLTELCREIAEEGDYKSLLRVLNGVRKEEKDNELLEIQLAEGEVELKMLKKTWLKEQKELSNDLEKANERIKQLKVEVEDVDFYGKEESRYTEDWQNARTYQNDLRLTKQENALNQIISTHLSKIEYENRIHNEIQDFIAENSEDMQNDISYWMQHYDDEIERRDSEIIKLKMRWEELTENHIKLRQVVEDRTAFIIERRAINEERRRLAELLKVQTAAAIKIQAWWRGTMVRKKLGPFRVKKKDKKGDKRKKGDKSKKGKKKK